MDEQVELEFWDATSVKIGIIGSGVMGKGIRDFFDSQGIQVDLLSARNILESTSTFKSQISTFDLIIESCLEDIRTKESILKTISQINMNGVIGTGTSSISVSELQNSVENPKRFCGIHFMNPPRAISVVELIAGAQSDQHTLAKTKKLLLDLEREVFEISDSPGFAVNSILISMLNQAVFTLDACGLEPRELDLIIKKTTGLKLGPLATIDLIGVDVTVKIIENMYASNPQNFLPPAAKLLKMLESGKLGRKTKIGFFEYL
jgi:3-hydroxybutyryl-CoA dehydrogenase